jgi:DNA replication protein DnaC
MTTAPPALAADLTAGLKRLKMAGMRRLAPELLLTAKTQRWNPEEFLRTLVEAEIAARDASNARTRRRQAMFPVSKTLDEFDLAASSVPRATFDYLGSLEWVRAAENVCLIGPAGTGKSHLLLAPRIRRRRRRSPSPLLHRRRAPRQPLPRSGRQQRRQNH